MSTFLGKRLRQRLQIWENLPESGESLCELFDIELSVAVVIHLTEDCSESADAVASTTLADLVSEVLLQFLDPNIKIDSKVCHLPFELSPSLYLFIRSLPVLSYTVSRH